MDPAMAVIRQWVRLAHWAEQEGESGEMYKKIHRSAELNNKGVSGLLGDPDLTIVRDWVDSQKLSAPWAERYGGGFDLVVTYLTNSEEAARNEAARSLKSGNPQVPGGVFICYRRDDSSGDARFISEALIAHFGSQRVFMDVDNIAPGIEGIRG
jgi:hypothetical protein